jgi:cellobiose-specific phosphotransferase system component IIC
MKEKVQEIMEKVKNIFKVVLNYSLIILGMSVFFTLGYYYKDIKTYSQRTKPVYIKRSEVTIAIDENSNFMIIAKNDGTYTMMEDSIGRAIFDIYAKNIWSQHQPITPISPK